MSLLLAMAAASGWTSAKLLVAGVWVSMALFEQRRGPPLNTHWTAHAVGACWFVLSVLVMCSTSTDGSWQSTGIGAGLMGLGALLRSLAIRTLGVGYADGVKPVRPRVGHGVYALFDHPGELGALLLAAGASMAVRSPWAHGWVLVALLPVTLYRFRLEEIFLRQTPSVHSALVRNAPVHNVERVDELVRARAAMALPSESPPFT